MKNIDEQVSILGVRVFSGGFKRALMKIEAALEDPGKKLLVVFTPNPEQIILSRDNEEFKRALLEVDLAVPDGAGVVLAARWLNQGKLGRVPGIELAEAAIKEAIKKDLKVLLLGGESGSAQRAIRNSKFEIRNLKNNHTSEKRASEHLGEVEWNSEAEKSPNVKNQRSQVIASGTTQNDLFAWDEGSKDIAHETDEERDQVLGRIKDFKPALVLVAYGAPWQELWVSQNRGDLQQAGVRVVMVVGGAFDIWAGKVGRAPLQWRKFGLEWLWRLVHEPRRWRRQLRLVKFGALVMAYGVGRRIGMIKTDSVTVIATFAYQSMSGRRRGR